MAQTGAAEEASGASRRRPKGGLGGLPQNGKRWPREVAPAPGARPTGGRGPGNRRRGWGLEAGPWARGGGGGGGCGEPERKRGLE